MARDVESLVLRMSADLRRFEKSMDQMRSSADRRLNDVEKRAQRSQRNLSRIMGQAGDGMVTALRTSLASLAPTLAAAFSTAQVVRYADAYTGLQNRLKATGLEGEALKRVEDALYEAANRNGVAVASTAELYQRAAMARENLGASEEQLLAIVSGTSAALRLQGTSAEAASGALLQLGQLLGGNMVQAQEYNSLIDQLPTVLEAVAKGSERWGGSVNKLTLDVKAGRVTVQEWAAAMLKGFEDIEARAGAATLTVGGALTTLNNQLGRYVGQADAGVSATQRMAQGIEALANNLDTIIPIVGVLAALVGTRYFLALTANSGALIANATATARLAAFQTTMTASMTGTTAATVAATGAMARLNAMMLANPVGAVALAFAGLAGAIVLLGRVTDGAVPPSRSLTNSTDALKRATDAYEEAARAAAVATGAEAKAAREAAAEKRALAAAARDAARAKLAEAQATIALVGIEARRKLETETFNFRGDRAGTTTPISPADRERVRQARADAAAAQAAIGEANRAIAAADAAIARSASSRGGGGGSASAARSGGSTRDNADQIARAREDLALEEAIARARASFDATAIKAAEERQRLVQLTRQYEAAGYTDANARATEHLALLNEAEQRAEGLADWIKQSDAFWESIGENAKKAAEAEQLAADQTRDRLGYEAELARLGGNEVMIRDAERRLFIHERTLEILRLQLAATKEQAAAMAGAEWDQLDRTEAGRDMARSIVDVLRSDNIWEEAGRRFRDAAWDGVEQLLSQIFSQMSGGKGGGGWLASLGSALFGGFRASGGPVVPGRAYVVGERRPEVFVPNTAGTVIPSVNAAMAALGGAGGGRDIRVSINLDGANGDETIRQIAYQAAAQGVGVAIGANRLAAQQAQRRQRQRFA